MLNNVFYYLAHIAIDLQRIIAVNASNEVWAFPKVGLILFAPLDPFVIFITRLYFSLFHGSLDLLFLIWLGIIT